MGFVLDISWFCLILLELIRPGCGCSALFHSTVNGIHWYHLFLPFFSMNSNTSPKKYSLLFQEYTVSIQDDFCVSSRDRLHTFVTEKEEVIALVLCSHHDVHVFFSLMRLPQRWNTSWWTTMVSMRCLHTLCKLVFCFHFRGGALLTLILPLFSISSEW